MKNGLMRVAARLPIRQWLRFNLVGLANTLVDMALFAVLSACGVFYAAAQTMAYGGGVLNSFLMNKRWTFRYTGALTVRDLLRFIGVNLLSLSGSILLLHVLLQTLSLPLLPSKLGATGLTMVVNFLGYKRVFKTDKACQPPS